MKQIIFILSIVYSMSSHAATETWSTNGSPHPLWEALNIKSVPVAHEFLKIQRKSVGEIECDQIEVASDNPILPSQIQYHCKFPGKVSPEHALVLFKAIKQKPIGTSAASIKVKVVNKMIVVGDSDTSENSSRVYLKHPCQKVETQKGASACMAFWAKNVLPRFEDTNRSAVVNASEANKTLAKKTLSWGGFKAQKPIDSADFLGLMGEYQDESHLYYFTLQKGNNVIPLQIMDFNVADLEYTPLGEAAKQSDDIEKLKLEVLETFFLKVDPKVFVGIGDDISEALEYLNEGQ